MNFFERQHRARRRTALLVACFVLAVVLIVAAVNVVVYWLTTVIAHAPGDVHGWLERPYWLWTTAAVLAVIAGGTLRSIVRLRDGGEAVAAMVGARRIDPATSDAAERRLLNVVEEMAIAAGAPVPTVYVMDGEPAINAFVAGYRPDEAVLVVTAGALAQLSRDELQGVVGHEFSHIMNGDMRLNVRLLSTLAGILLIGQLGGFLLRSLRYASSGRARRGAQGMAVVLLLGLTLSVVGYIGLAFGRLIKAAVSRQRELLADASSVQFTRNPEGIAGALWKIMTHAGGSRLLGAHAEDMSHMCFAESLRFSLRGLFATHPPLEARIAAIDPSFLSRRRALARGRQAAERLAEREGAAAPTVAAGFTAGAVLAVPAAIADTVGSPRAEHLDYARTVHASLPPALLAAVRGAEGARAVLYGLLLAEIAPEEGEAASALLPAHAGDALAATAAGWCATLHGLGREVRLPLLNLALPALRALPAADRRRFLDGVERLVASDRRMTMFELAVTVILRHQLGPGAGRAQRVRFRRYEPVLQEVRTLLSALARAGHADEDEAREVFVRVMRYFGRRTPEPLPVRECTASRVMLALHKLAGLSPFLKRSLLNACGDCVLADRHVRFAEAELLRATAEALDCPMPPLLPQAA